MRTASGHVNSACWSIIALAVIVPFALRAQAVAPTHWYVERALHERWITPDQRPDQLQFTDTVARYRIDSIADGGRSRTFYLTTGNFLFGVFTLDSNGRLSALDAGIRGVPPLRTPGASEHDTKLRMWEDFLHNRIGMPQARLWDVVALFHPTAIKAGVAWIDTLDFSTEQSGFRQALRGVRRSVILRDTVVLGRTMYVTRDSAQVSYLERFLPEELPDPRPRPVIERTTSGTIVGTSVYDPEFRLFFARRDTTRLAGTATRAYLNDPILRTPISYLRTREWTLVDSATAAAHIAAQRATAVAALNRERPPPVAPGARRDSLIAFTRRLIAAGDSVAAFGTLDVQLDGQFILPGTRRIDVEALQLILPMLADRQRAFARNLDYVGMIYGLNRHLTGAAPAITSDTARWACVPDACAYLASQWEKTSDERLRNLGLIAHFVVEPARWASTLDQRAKVDSELLDGVLALRRGVATTWPAGTHAPMPAANAAWPAWVEWMNGHDPAYPLPVLPNRAPPPARMDVRFGPTHVAAVQMYQLVSGRNIINEWRQQLAAASDDSAKLVFTTMLTGMHAGQSSPAEIAARVRDTSTIVRGAAVKEVVALFDGTPPAADSATTRDIQDRFLAIALDRALFWPPLPPGPRTGSPRGFIEVEAQRPGDSLFIASGALAAALRAKWGSRARVLDDSALRTAMSPFRSTYFRPSAVWQVGPFVKATLDYGFDTPGSSHRAPSPGVFFGSTTVYLMKTDNGWVVVTEQTRIT